MTKFKTEIIEKYITENKISKTEFCKRCKIGTNTLKKIYENNYKINIIVLFKIVRILEIKISDFL